MTVSLMIQNLTKTMKTTAEYKAIKSLYGDAKAARSGVPLINHIEQELAIIEAVSKHKIMSVKFDVEMAQRAFCLHPIFQSDANLEKYGVEVASLIQWQFSLRWNTGQGQTTGCLTW